MTVSKPHNESRVGSEIHSACLTCVASRNGQVLNGSVVLNTLVGLESNIAYVCYDKQAFATYAI